jgi:hypothetical protein
MGGREYPTKTPRRRGDTIALHVLALLGIALVGLGLGVAIDLWPSRQAPRVAQLPIATPMTTHAPVAIPARARTVAPTITPTRAPAALAGAWQLTEANRLVGTMPQRTVPFRETNCGGTTSVGTVHVDRFAPDGRAFAGTFAENGALLGPFTATQR